MKNSSLQNTCLQITIKCRHHSVHIGRDESNNNQGTDELRIQNNTLNL